ncbi:MAG: hypothetical protein MJ080_04830 [Clostridia bacterium]|nr:hypothetical protein [Clostridia bacterium]
MERVFDGEIYDMICQNGNLVFTYCKSANESAVLVGYKMISKDNPEPTDVAKNIYLLSKFGSNYRNSSELCSNYVKAKTAELASGVLCLVADTGKAYMVDQTGMPIWSGDLDYKGEHPSGIAAYKNSIWACYQKSGVLLRFNLTTMREELRIGGTNSPFNNPCHIFVDGNVATVSNSGSNKLIEVNLDSYVVEPKEEFSESVYSFVKYGDKRYALLESGLYLI